MVFLKSIDDLGVDGNRVLAEEDCWSVGGLVHNLFKPVMVPDVGDRVSFGGVGLQDLSD